MQLGTHVGAEYHHLPVSRAGCYPAVKRGALWSLRPFKAGTKRVRKSETPVAVGVGMGLLACLS